MPFPRLIYLFLFGVALGLIAMMSFLALTGCDYKPTAEQKQAAQTKRILNEVNNKLGMPNVHNFQQKRLMKEIYELCDKENLICYAYLQSEMTGKLTFIGKCVGFGVPFSAQYTNPQAYRKVTDGQMRSYEIMPQADPNGLYMPTSSSATWLMMIDPETNEPRPVYFEPKITVSPFKLPSAE